MLLNTFFQQVTQSPYKEKNLKQNILSDFTQNALLAQKQLQSPPPKRDQTQAPQDKVLQTKLAVSFCFICKYITIAKFNILLVKKH